MLESAKFLSFFFLLCSVLFLRCEEEKTFEPYYQEENGMQFTDRYELVPIGEKAFPLDNETGFYHYGMHKMNSAGKDYLVFLNSLNATIYLYQYDNPEKVVKVKLSLQGPDGVGDVSENSVVYAKSLDSIYFLNTRQDRLFLLNRNGRIYERYNFKNLEDKYGLEPIGQRERPVVSLNNNLFFAGTFSNFQVKDLSEIPVILEFNALEETAEWRFTLPEIYQQAFWSFHNFNFEPSISEGKDESTILISFPVSPFIFSWQPDKNYLDKHYVSTKFFRTVEPMSLDPDDYYDVWSDFAPYNEYTMTNSCFGQVIKLNDDFFLRETLIRPNLERYKEGVRLPDSSFIIFDKEFRKLGETKLPSGTYFRMMSFVADGQLHIANSRKFIENESLLTFDKFQLKRKSS